MKRKLIKLAVIVFAAVPSLGHADFGMQWINSVSNRVAAMAGAALGIEDETTGLNLLNAGNPAGLVLTPKENRLDLNFGGYFEEISNQESKSVKSGFESVSPGPIRNGLTIWPDENLAISTQFEIHSQINKYSGYQEGVFGFYGGAGNLIAAYKMDEFTFGGQVKYFKLQTNGLPSYTDFDQYNLQLTHLGWHMGVGYNSELFDGDVLTVGVAVGAEDREPDYRLLDGSMRWPDSNYDTSLELAGTMDIMGVDPKTGLPFYYQDAKFIFKEKTTRKPFQVVGQIIYDIDNKMQLGLLINYVNESIWTSEEDKWIPATPYDTNMDFKSGEYIGCGFSPILRGQLTIADEGIFNYGAFYSNNGSYFKDEYEMKLNKETYRSACFKGDANIAGVGFGYYQEDKTFSAAFQYDQKRLREKYERFMDGSKVYSYERETVFQQAIRLGAECLLTEGMLLRGGYACLNDQHPNSDRKTETINRFSLGLGLDFSTNMSGNALVAVDLYDQPPTEDYKHMAVKAVVGIKRVY